MLDPSMTQERGRGVRRRGGRREFRGLGSYLGDYTTWLLCIGMLDQGRRQAGDGCQDEVPVTMNRGAVRAASRVVIERAPLSIRSPEECAGYDV